MIRVENYKPFKLCIYLHISERKCKKKKPEKYLLENYERRLG